MNIDICCAPCCWGVDDIRNPYLPPWRRVLDEASEAGYAGLELGPFGYLPKDPDHLADELEHRNLRIVAGTIFDNLVDNANRKTLVQQARDICMVLKRLYERGRAGHEKEPPMLVVIDWGHEARNQTAGHSQRAPRLDAEHRVSMYAHIGDIATVAANEFGVRTVVHPHAGGYIEFADEIEQLAEALPHERIGLCLDTGHLRYSGMDPQQWLVRYAGRLDYVHFKDINAEIHARALRLETPFFEACAEGVMCPLGCGSLDYSGIRDALARIGYRGAITVEQERDPRQSQGSLRDIAQSLAFLHSIGFNSRRNAA